MYLSEKSIQEDIADTVNITEEEVGGEAHVQSNEEGDTEDQDNQMPTELELDEASTRRQKGVLIIDMDVHSTETTGAEPEIIEDVSRKGDIYETFDMEKIIRQGSKKHGQSK